jgi:NADH-quinone oxidoreductase subunit A
MATPTAIVAYLTLFVAVGFLFLFVNLLVGWLLRPKLPNNEKLEVYECGEPAIGSSFVQFDLRFYVVALLFIIFDVEVAFFFPWATVYGKATQLAAVEAPLLPSDTDAMASSTSLSHVALARHRELGIHQPVMPTLTDTEAAQRGVKNDPAGRNREAVVQLARKLAAMSFADILVFFAVLMVGFFYVWKRGDLDWVRAVTRQHHERGHPPEHSERTEPSSSILSA